MANQRRAKLLVIFLLALLLLGCGAATQTLDGEFSTPAPVTPIPRISESPNPDFLFAQATLASGNSQLLDLSHQATLNSQAMTQAANSSALSTQDDYQRQKIQLDYQATVVSLDMAQAAATQKSIEQQVQTARNSTIAAGNSAATATGQANATSTAYPLTATAANQQRNTFETVQVQAILNAQVTSTAQAVATMTVYPLTATPQAATRAVLLMTEYDREQRSFIDQVVIPLVPIIATLDLLLFVLFVILALRRFVQHPRLMGSARIDLRPMLPINRFAADRDMPPHRFAPLELMPKNPSGPPKDNSVYVEIVDATVPPVVDWVEDVEHQLGDKGDLLL